MSARIYSNHDLTVLVQDARCLKGATRHLMNALALKVSSKSGYSCFPNYATLALDTGLSDFQLRRTAAALQKMKDQSMDSAGRPIAFGRSQAVFTPRTESGTVVSRHEEFG